MDKARLCAGRVTSSTYHDTDDSASFAACRISSLCKRMRLLDRPYRTFSRILNKRMVTYHSALTYRCFLTVVVQTEPVRERKSNNLVSAPLARSHFVAPLSPSDARSQHYCVLSVP
ncbi:hypothetical protein EVAR_38414_1 [Eumeta japonica]|uniref:Uncharacterized protein n=1 Tax=Eumeta variegata TaxID=151549 RepID=A0A4C1X0H6_EUMVA|nr:hypothetical protein EVAR_38414_1 [Eumeta japonica]